MRHVTAFIVCVVTFAGASSALAAEYVLYASAVGNANGWDVPLRVRGNPGCTNCPCDDNQYAKTPGNGWLNITEFDHLSLPHNERIVEVRCNFMGRYNDATNGRVEMQILPFGASIRSPVFASTKNCRWRMGDQKGITHLATGWNADLVNSLQVRLRRAGQNDTPLRVKAVRLKVITEIVPCQYGVSTQAIHVGADGGDAPVNVFTNVIGCHWTAQCNASWAHVASGAAGDRNATAILRISPNSGGARSTVATVAGHSVTINQSACSYSVDVAPQTTISASGGTVTVRVTTNGAACSWSASSAAPWIQPDQGTRVGSGTVVLTIGANPSGVGRRGSVTVAGRTVAISQAAGVCEFAVSPERVVLPGAGGSFRVDVAANLTDCPWRAEIGRSVDHSAGVRHKGRRPLL